MNMQASICVGQARQAVRHHYLPVGRLERHHFATQRAPRGRHVLSRVWSLQTTKKRVVVFVFVFFFFVLSLVVLNHMSEQHWG